MDLIIVSLNNLSYEQLSDLHKTIKDNIKSLDAQLEPSRDKKLCEATPEELALMDKRIKLYRIRLQVAERIMEIADRLPVNVAV
jgi:hypothetical protein